MDPDFGKRYLDTLAQMGCATVSVDASAKALELGKQWYEHIPPALMPRPPQFLVFDGHRIDLPDASVDRIISFDAFHHVANPKEVIAEFARVLKPRCPDGGRQQRTGRSESRGARCAAWRS